MKLLLLSLMTLLIATAIASLAGSDTGYVLITILGWTIQTSVTLFIIILFLSFVILYFFIRSLARLWSIPHNIKIWKKRRNQDRVEKQLTQGLICMTEGRWKQAEHNFCKAISYSRTPYVNYIYAARAAQALQAIDRRDDYLKLAYKNNLDQNVAIGLTQAELQLDQKQIEQALATLKHLQHKSPNQIQVKRLLLEIYTQLNDWQSVLELIPTIEKIGLYSREQIQEKQLEAYVGVLKKTGELNNKDELNSVWMDIPRKLRQHFYLIETYVNERLKFADTSDCEDILRRALKKQWDSILIRLYGLVEGKNPSKQFEFLERHLQNHAGDSVLLLSLGRLCIRNKLWGKARYYLEQSLDMQPNPEAYYEYAKFHEHSGNYEKASLCYEKGLALAISVQ